MDRLNKLRLTMAELPEILTAQHIADHLAITRKTVYELLKRNPERGGIPCFAIGTSKRVDKDDFRQWIQSRKGKHLKMN